MTYTIAEHRFRDRSYWCVLDPYGRIVEEHERLSAALAGVRIILILLGC